MASPSYYSPESGHKLNVKDMEIPQYVKNWLNYLIVERGLSPKSVFDYASSIKTLLRWVKNLQLHLAPEHFHTIPVEDVLIEELASLTRNDIYEYLSYCTTELNNSAQSRLCKLTAARSLYTFLKTRVDNSPVKEDPTQGISSPKRPKRVPKFLEVSEARRLLCAVTGESESRDYCMILWFLSCGMRLSELVGINMGDVKENMLRVYGKGRKERLIYLNRQCVDALENYLIEREAWHVDDNEKALFVSKRTRKRLTTRRVEQIVERNLLRAGLDGMGFSVHKLRHSTATNLYSEGTGLLEIKEILGHSSLKSTEVYTHLVSREATVDALERLGNSLAAPTEEHV